jgi:hypothetical protein
MKLQLFLLTVLIGFLGCDNTLKDTTQITKPISPSDLKIEFESFANQDSLSVGYLDVGSMRFYHFTLVGSDASISMRLTDPDLQLLKTEYPIGLYAYLSEVITEEVRIEHSRNDRLDPLMTDYSRIEMSSFSNGIIQDEFSTDLGGENYEVVYSNEFESLVEYLNCLIETRSAKNDCAWTRK